MRNSIVRKIFIGCMLLGINIAQASPGVERLNKKSVVVIGSGIGALTTSIFLARSGLHPIIISGKNYGGALSQSLKYPKLAWRIRH
jgi:ribulose 1,5-bisphosphate synthetase/thiazole synthase